MKELVVKDVYYMKRGTYLQTYCPVCNKGLNVKDKPSDYVALKIKIDGQLGDLKLSPYLDVYESKSDITLKKGREAEDIQCPHCKTSLADEKVRCEVCDAKATKIIISAFSRLIPFYFCSRYGCTWHNLSKADTNKIKLQIERQHLPEQDKTVRVRNFDEVPLGYTREQAVVEANRCIQCRNPKCVTGCPVEINIPAFIKLIAEEKFVEAAWKIKEKNALPAICGRVCPQEEQCEEMCVLGKITGESCAIGNLERFAADYERKMGKIRLPAIKPSSGMRVAIVGSGPAGLTMAADMVKQGHSVVIYEALHKPGGVLLYGIPEFRLPKEIVEAEINYLKRMGVRIETNAIVGKLHTIDELLERFDYVYVASGAGLPVFMHIPGENLNNIFSANEFLTRINLMKAYRFPEYDTPTPKGNNVVVVGGGNVAMDCARCALRSGAAAVTVVYRRSRQEMPARLEEIRHAEEEGIKFRLLTNPVRYVGNDLNWLRKVECIKMRLGAPDRSGRRRPVPIEGSNFEIEADLAIVAIGAGPNPVLFQTTSDLTRNKWGYIDVKNSHGETYKENVFAGGDITTGSATVIAAMGAARTTGKELHRLLIEAKKR